MSSLDPIFCKGRNDRLTCSFLMTRTCVTAGGHSSGAVQKSFRNAGTFLSSINSSCNPTLPVTRHPQLLPTNPPSHQLKWHPATLRLPPTLTLTASTPLHPETSLSPPLVTSLESSSATTLLLSSMPRPFLLAPLLLSSTFFSIDYLLYLILTFFQHLQAQQHR